MSPTKPKAVESIQYRAFREGCGLPGWTLFVNFVSLGAVLAVADFNLFQGLLTTLLIYALPGQIVMIDGVVTEVSLLGIALLVFLINARLFPMSLATAPILSRSPHSRLSYYLAAHFIAVTGWLNFMSRYPKVKTHQVFDYFVYSNLAMWIFSMLGTAVGFYAAGYIPYPLFVSLILINPLYFLCVIAMSGSDNLPIGVAVVCGGLLYPPLSIFSADWALLLAGLAGGTLAALIKQRKK